MGIIGGNLGNSLLRLFQPMDNVLSEKECGKNLEDTKLTLFFGDNFYKDIKGKTIIDFGCGAGKQAVEMALNGALKVIGVDIQEELLRQASCLAKKYGVAELCSFVTSTTESADMIISKDSFEHFSEPDVILRQMGRLLKPGGYIFAAFGPTWYHPQGGHFFLFFRGLI